MTVAPGKRVHLLNAIYEIQIREAV